MPDPHSSVRNSSSKGCVIQAVNDLLVSETMIVEVFSSNMGKRKWEFGWIQNLRMNLDGIWMDSSVYEFQILDQPRQPCEGMLW
jgi:hypothetical protein